MVILAIETTGRLASAALYKDGCISEKSDGSEYSHLQRIAPMIAELLNERGVSPESLDAVAVSRGPGSFTGIRIGMATAKALAQVWDKPVICVPTLMSFAFSGSEELLTKKNGEKLLFCPVFDARRSQVYAGAYEPLSRRAVVSDAAYGPDEYIEKLREVSSHYDRLIFFGDGIEPFKEKLENCGLPAEAAPEELRYQKASWTARLAAEMFKDGLLDDCFSASPEYLRLAEAERKLKEKSPEGK
ncbi:MAG: tRNA (adenosine(37)-N6)-threonylcarbamoyltransferase complex dimerization subunit type 1 TsaB [Firmicutes bacterium]|nr:tRNA (adenosine(37)-N6)-threonylcarbamoyltransferase complex dimerization subunit type 1 TsaB [Bacillota bacterium]